MQHATFLSSGWYWFKKNRGSMPQGDILLTESKENNKWLVCRNMEVILRSKKAPIYGLSILLKGWRYAPGAATYQANHGARETGIECARASMKLRTDIGVCYNIYCAKSYMDEIPHGG
jgi:hypothetical protein